MRTTRLAAAVGLATLLGCASGAKPPVAASGAAPAGRNDRCRFLRIEHQEINRDVGADSVMFTLVVTPPGQAGGGSEAPVNAKVLVQRERAVGLQAELEQAPDLLCEPEGRGTGAYRVQLPAR